MKCLYRLTCKANFDRPVFMPIWKIVYVYCISILIVMEQKSAGRHDLRVDDQERLQKIIKSQRNIKQGVIRIILLGKVGR